MEIIDFKKLKKILDEINDALVNFTNIEKKFIIEQYLMAVNIFQNDTEQKALRMTKALINLKKAQNKDK